MKFLAVFDSLSNKTFACSEKKRAYQNRWTKALCLYYYCVFNFIKVPITPNFFFCPLELLCRTEQNGEKNFLFGHCLFHKRISLFLVFFALGKVLGSK